MKRALLTPFAERLVLDLTASSLPPKGLRVALNSALRCGMARSRGERRDQLPFPAIVVMTPSAPTFRMRLLSVSAI